MNSSRRLRSSLGYSPTSAVMKPSTVQNCGGGGQPLRVAPAPTPQPHLNLSLTLGPSRARRAWIQA